MAKGMREGKGEHPFFSFLFFTSLVMTVSVAAAVIVIFGIHVRLYFDNRCSGRYQHINHAVEIVEKREQIEGQFDPSFPHGSGQFIRIHYRGWII